MMFILLYVCLTCFKRSAATTNPQVMEAVIELCYDSGAKKARTLITRFMMHADALLSLVCDRRIV